MNKRAIAILGAIFILIVGTLGFLIYSRSKNPETTVNTEVPVVEETTPIESAPVEPEPVTGAVRLTDAGDPVVSPILFYQGNGISYFNSLGQLFQTDLQITSDTTALLSNKQELSIALKANISRILWPLVGNSFIAEFNTSSKPSWSYYDSNKASYVDIPSQVYSLDWMPSGDKIMFVWVDNGKATLNVANPDTTGYTVLTDLYEPDNVISVAPNGQNVLFYRTQTTDVTKNTINMVSIDGKTFSSIVKDGYNTGVLWSPDSKKFLFTKRDSNQRFGLWVADITTGEIKSLGVTTSQNKAVWSKDSTVVYAAVPNVASSGQGLTEDTIVKITVANAQTKEYPTGIAVDAENLFLSSDANILFFKNAQDNALYYIAIQ